MRSKLFAVVLLLVAAVLCTPPLMAQEQRGAIEGIVKDASGGVLPGVTVEAKNVAVGSVASTVTDAAGMYRFPSLAAGHYDVTASLAGFATRKFEAVEVLLGQIKKADFALSIAGVTETVQVSAETPLVDVRQSARSTSMRAEQIDLLPKGRDFTSVVTQAPGANNENGKLGGLSIDGASAGENRYIVDGVETTNLQNGTSGKLLVVDFIDEVQVKSSGYTAEYGGATGGVVNAVTKSGTNTFRGAASMYWQGDKLEGSSNKTLRLNPSNSNVAEYHTYAEDGYNRIDPAISLGGPILKDRAWFFGGYQPRFEKIQRVVNPTTAGNPIANSFDQEQKIRQQNISANTTGQWGNNLRTRVAYNNSLQKQIGRLPSLAGTDAAATNFGIDAKLPNWNLGATADWVVKPNFFIGVRGGYYFSDAIDYGVPTVDRILYNASAVGVVGLDGTPIPAEFQYQSGYQNILTNNARTRDQQTRKNFQVDSTYYGNFGGQHTLKGGVQLDRVGNNVLSGEQGNLVRIYPNRPISGLRGNYGYYQVRSNGVDPSKGFITEGDVHTTNIGLFIQDAWTVNNKLTINLGLRTERERVPTYIDSPEYPEYAVEFSFKDKLAPRVGFAYDVKGDGKWKAFGSWGVFYDIFKLQLPRGSFGGEKWIEYYYPLNDPNPFNLTKDNAACPPACSGGQIRPSVDYRHVSLGSDAIDPDLKPMKMQEASFGLEHQLSNVVAVSARYVHKQIDRAIEDLGTLDADQNEIYIVGNPGFGLATRMFDVNGDPIQGVAFPKAKRDYDSVEFAVQKNMANNWYLRASYLWSRLYGNYSGLSQSDENGRTDPNVGRAFDYPAMMFDGTGKAEYGPLGTDRPHQMKAQFIYQLPTGTAVGFNQYVASGLPVTREIGVFAPNAMPVQYLGRMSDGRTPVYSQTDLNLQHAFRVGGNRQLQLALNVYNLFNQRTAINKFVTYQKDNGSAIDLDEALFYAGQENIAAKVAATPKDPRFLMENGFQDPLAARISVRFLF